MFENGLSDFISNLDIHGNNCLLETSSKNSKISLTKTVWTRSNSLDRNDSQSWPAVSLIVSRIQKQTSLGNTIIIWWLTILQKCNRFIPANMAQWPVDHWTRLWPDSVAVVAVSLLPISSLWWPDPAPGYLEEILMESRPSPSTEPWPARPGSPPGITLGGGMSWDSSDTQGALGGFLVRSRGGGGGGIMWDSWVTVVLLGCSRLARPGLS